MKTEEIKRWLKDQQKDRHWLAEQLRATKGTIDQWFSRGFPDGVVAMIKLMMINKSPKTSGLDVEFSPGEWNEITTAMNNAGYTAQRAFFKDGILFYAEDILKRENIHPMEKPPEQQLRVADESPGYNTNHHG